VNRERCSPRRLHVVNVRVVLTEPCPAKLSDAVHKYSPSHHHNGQFFSDEDSVTSSQLDADDDEDGAGSSDWSQQSAVRGRYGRRYNPPDTVVIVERPSVTDRTYSVTGHALQTAVTSSSGSTARRRAPSPSVGVQLALPLLATTAMSLTVRLLFHCYVDCLSASLAVCMYMHNAALLQ